MSQLGFDNLPKSLLVSFEYGCFRSSLVIVKVLLHYEGLDLLYAKIIICRRGVHHVRVTSYVNHLRWFEWIEMAANGHVVNTPRFLGLGISVWDVFGTWHLCLRCFWDLASLRSFWDLASLSLVLLLPSFKRFSLVWDIYSLWITFLLL